MLKPHIFMMRGFWRVNPMPKPYRHHQRTWAATHKVIAQENDRIRGSEIIARHTHSIPTKEGNGR